MANKHRELKTSVYEQLARIGKCLSSGPRLEILDLLSQGPRSVERIAAEVGQSVANCSRHLQVLRRARLVDADKQGLRVCYRLASDEVSSVFLSMRRLAENRLLEIEHITRDFFAAEAEAEPASREELIERMRGGEVTILDVRPVEEFMAGHVPGAISIPITSLHARLAELPPDREVVAYCRGPYCVMAFDAVEILRKHGLGAYRFDEGIADWRRRGLPVDVPTPGASETERAGEECPR